MLKTIRAKIKMMIEAYQGYPDGLHCPAIWSNYDGGYSGDYEVGCNIKPNRHCDCEKCWLRFLPNFALVIIAKIVIWKEERYWKEIDDEI